MPRSLVASRVSISRVNSVLFNNGFETAPSTITAPTNTAPRWIDGTAGGSFDIGYGWATISLASSAQAGYDTTTSNSGTNSMKLSTLNSTGTVVVGNYRNSAAPDRRFILKPSTSYTVKGYIKTNNAASNSVFMDLREYDSALSILATTSSTKFSGTNGFTKVSFVVTTNASTVIGTVLLRINVAGNTSDAWFDDITVWPTNLVRSLSGSRSVVV